MIEQLGRGGMAVVYRALDESRGVTVALKQSLLQNNPARDREFSALFQSEFHTLAQLKHPSVIAVYDYGVDVSGPYYTMELLEGGDLTDSAPLPYRRACALLMQISSSLSLLHARGQLHRDIGPRNVRITPDDRAKLIDFGAMTAMGPCTQVVGTPAFMAPEVAHRLTLDGRTDLFSLGATLYFALTGRLAYPARDLAELRDVWRREPPPPSAFVAEIPAALDSLVMSLIGIDPARRPRNAFEVMQRLAAIAGVAEIEASDVSLAYLATPTLVGREVNLRQFREHMQQAMRGQGGSLLFETAAGLGRTRMLDACVLEAKTLGASVVRVRGGTDEGVAFASAHELASQLCELLPREAPQYAREAGALSALFSGNDIPELAPLSEWRSERFALQTALANWINRVCQQHPLLIAVDDSERVDEASMALIAALAHTAKTHALSIVAMLATGDEASRPLSLQVLREQCLPLPLSALTPAETEALFASVFANAPNVPLLSDRIHRVAAGSPRDSMALAQHLLDRKLVRYVDGNWRLPAELAVHDLPTSLEEAVRSQLARMSPLASSLVQTQALAIDGPWTRADYAEIAGSEPAHRVDEALHNLLRAGVLVGNGSVFTLKHHAVRDNLRTPLTAADTARRHLLLADLCVHSNRPALLEVHHALLGGDVARGIDRTAALLETLSNGASIYEISPIDPKLIAGTLEAAYEHAREARRSPRMLSELARHLSGMSIPTDTNLFYRYGWTWLKQLQQDSGYDDYLATDPVLAPNERLKLALEKTMSRYAATPEAERVYALNDAIKYLAQWVTTAIVMGSRRCDTALLASLPGKLEPFAILSPILHALWQNVIAAGEMNYQAKPEQARQRVQEVYERLAAVSVRDLPNADAIRYAVAYATGVLEVALGYPTAEDWIEIMKAHPLQQVNAMSLRRILAIYAENVVEAENYRKQAEVLAVQASSRQMFDIQYLLELAAHVTARDLTGVKQTADRIEEITADAPGWMPQHHLAQACYQRLRGDLPAAKLAAERALALVDPSMIDPPPNLNVWVNAAGNYTHVLLELGMVAEAREFAEKARAICIERGMVTCNWASHIERGLALAEAKQGDFARARERLDRLIEQRSSLVPSRLTIDYEARARVAIMERDPADARRYVGLAAGNVDSGITTMLTKQARLYDEAKQAGIDFSMPVTSFESSLFASDGPDSTRSPVLTVNALLQAEPDSAGRAQRALELLCEAAQARSGHLFFARDAALERAASFGDAADTGLIEAATRWWNKELAQADLDTLITGDLEEEDSARVTVLTSVSGLKYRVSALKSAADGDIAYVGLVLLATHNASDVAAEYWPMSSAIVTRLVADGDAQLMYRA